MKISSLRVGLGTRHGYSISSLSGAKLNEILVDLPSANCCLLGPMVSSDWTMPVLEDGALSNKRVTKLRTSFRPENE